MPSDPVRLVQISDVHLGRRGGPAGMPRALLGELAAARLEAVRQACQAVREYDAAALLVAGDLFDRPQIDEALYEPVRTLFGDLGRPVVVSPGNHDAFGPASVWNRRTLERLGLAVWPQNVHVFETRAISRFTLPGADVHVWGHRVEGYHSQDDSPLAQMSAVEGGGRHVGLLHGALLEWSGGPTTMPFSASRLAACGFDYAAVGHYHGYRTIEHEGRLLGAYAGTPVPGGFDEDPHGGVLVVELGERTGLTLLEPWPGRMRALELVAVPAIRDEDDAIGRINALLAHEGVGPQDIVHVSLRGLSLRPIDTGRIAAAAGSRCRAFSITDQTEPEVAAGRDARVTVESQFIRHMEAQIADAADAARRAVLEAARHYGLVALRGREAQLRPPVWVSEPGTEAADAD